MSSKLHTLATCVTVAMGIGSLYYMVSLIRKQLAEERAADESRKRFQEKMQQHRPEDVERNKKIALTETNSHESLIMNDVVFPSQLDTSFADIGGLSPLKQSLYESVILPLQHPELFKKLHSQSSLLSIPHGILFYGPPGTGKTLIAKAIAKSVNCTFIDVKPSTLQNKWFGESQKLVRAVFSLAHKFAPSIVFIDECDSFMRKRGSSSDHEASSHMRSEFLTLWDGLLTSGDPSKPIVVLACTNRPMDLDDAFLRRLPRMFLFDLPTLKEREAILRVLLKGQDLDADVSLQWIAKQTHNYSGSDLKEVCKAAAMVPLRELIKSHAKSNYMEVMGTSSASSSRKNSSAKKPAKDAAATTAAASVTATAAAASSSTTEDADKDKKLNDALAASLKEPASASSSSSSTSSHIDLPDPRPLRLNDFRIALQSIKPSSYKSMPALKAFEKERAAAGGVNAYHQPEDEDEEEEEEEHDEDDGDEHEENAASSSKDHKKHLSNRGEEESDDDIYK